MLDGGAANDVLTGGSGADCFVFTTGFGSDLITDFRNVDRIVIDHELFEDFRAVLDASDQVGRDIVITLDPDNTITLQNVQLATLDAGDFFFA